MARGQSGKRLTFLLQQYHAWVLTREEDSPLLLESSRIQVKESTLGSFLSFSHPDLMARYKVKHWHFQKEGRVVVEITGHQGKSPSPIALVPREAECIGSERMVRQHRFSRWARGLLENNFPGIRWTCKRTGKNYSQLFSTYSIRFLGRKNNEQWAAVLVDSDYRSENLYGVLSIATNWMGELSRRYSSAASLYLYLVLPRKSVNRVFRLLSLLDPSKVQWMMYRYEHQKSMALIRQKPSLPPLAVNTPPSQWPCGKPWHTCPIIEKLTVTYLSSFRRFPRSDGGFSFRYLGLELLRSYGSEEDKFYFGPPDFSRQLTDDTWADFQALVREVSTIRRYDSQQKNHPYYCWQAERWLEERLLGHIQVLDPFLDERFVYSQVPTFSGGQRGIVDLLGVNQHNRLVVVEIKLEKNLEILWQALDYWERVHRHNLENEFERRGFFPGVRLSKEEPLLFLVAPALAFHATLERQASLVQAQIPIYKIGLHGNWRRKVAVAFRRRIDPGRDRAGMDHPTQEIFALNC